MLEVASPSTYRHDLTRKKDLYASVLGVREYYIYDPYHEVDPYFQGYRLVDGVYEEIEFVDERLPSVVLDLELGENDGVFGLYNPNRSVWLQPLGENDGVFGLYNPNRSVWLQPLEEQVKQEVAARQRAEAELAKALEAIKRLEEKS